MDLADIRPYTFQSSLPHVPRKRWQILQVRIFYVFAKVEGNA